MMASIKYEEYSASSGYICLVRDIQFLFSLLCSQMHYRQDMAALLSPQTKHKKEAEVTPSFIISIWEDFTFR